MPDYAAGLMAGAGFSGVNAKTYCGAVGDGVTDDYKALKYWLDISSSQNPAAPAPKGYLPYGLYRTSQPLVFNAAYINLFGDGRQASVIIPDPGVSGGLVAGAGSSLSGSIHDIGITGDSTTGSALDLTAITTNLDCNFIRLALQSGGTAFAASNLNSCVVEHVNAFSYNSHSFLAFCSNGTVFNSCTAEECGTGKAGYRLAGRIFLVSCDGINSGDYWGVFGNDTGGSDGFQSDFSFNDSPGVILDDPTIRQWAGATATASAIMLPNSFNNFDIRGGRWARTTSSNYHSLLRFKKGAAGIPGIARLSIGELALGTGVVTAGYLYLDAGYMTFLDVDGVLGANGIQTYFPGPSYISHVVTTPYTPISWNLSDVTAGTILSNGNLTALAGVTATDNYSGRANASIKSGQKVFFSSTYDIQSWGGANDLIGLADSSFTLTVADVLGQDTHSLGIDKQGNVWYNGGLVTTLATFIVGSVVDYAVDLVNNKVWIRADGGGWNNDILANQNPATNTGGISIAGYFTGNVFPAFTAFHQSAGFGGVAAKWTGNFGPYSNYLYAPPAGFSNLFT